MDFTYTFLVRILAKVIAICLKLYDSESLFYVLLSSRFSFFFVKRPLNDLLGHVKFQNS